MNQETFPLQKMQKAVMSAIAVAPTLIGNEGLNFFLDSFRNEAWLGSSGMDKWPRRKDPTKWGKVKRPGRALLIDTGRLRRSVRIVRKSPLEIVWGSDVPYAQAHNEGIRLGVMQQVGEFTRRTKTGKKALVHAHTRRINQNIPKRQFMGNSTYLNKRLERMLAAEFNRTLKTI